MRFFFLFLLLTGLTSKIYSQETDFGVFYGKFYALYKSKDDGTGFRNTPKSQYSGYPTIHLNKQFTEKISGEAAITFLAYQQYTGTRLYTPGYFSVFYSGNISVTCNYTLIKAGKFESRLKGGLGIGIIPDTYKGEFVELFSTGTSIDSISRGNIKRDFTPLFPTLCAGIDFSYRLGKRFKIGLGINYQKGFLKVTEYDVYYNDGSGKNDQHARQWGNGTFYAFHGGIRYVLTNNKK